MVQPYQTLKVTEKRVKPAPTELELMQRAIAPRVKENFIERTNPYYHSAGKAVSLIIKGVNEGVLHPVSCDSLVDFDNSYKNVEAFYKNHYQFHPFVLRWGNTMVVFDVSKLPPIVNSLYLLIKQGKIQPETEAVRKFINNNPVQLYPLFPATAFAVWVENDVYVFDSNLWQLSGRVSESYIDTWKCFNTAKGWN